MKTIIRKRFNDMVSTVNAISVLAIATLLNSQTALAEQASNLESIIVVSDDNYPPYIFRDGDGILRGILAEQWACWEEKTGIHVDLRAMDWADAQKQMSQGKANVIDTIFFTEERAKTLEFTPPYAQIEVPVYIDSTLGGITDIPSMAGFTVGVKAGDSAITYLKARGIDTFKEYPSYEAIILAAKRGEIKVFSIDKPAAIFFLAKHNARNKFREAFMLYTGNFHRAVQKDNIGMLKLLEKGFGSISPTEYRAINRKWLKSQMSFSEVVWHWRYRFLTLAVVMSLLLLASLVLGHRVRKKSTDLVKSKQLLAENHELMKLFLFHSPIYTFVREVTATENHFVMASENFKDLTQFSGIELIGKTVEEVFPEAFAKVMDGGDKALLQEGGIVKAVATINDRHISIAQYPILLGDRTLLAGYAIDITDRINAEKIREETETRYRVLTENMKDVVWILDTETLKILYISPSVFKLRGYAAEEVIGNNIIHSLFPAQAEKIETVIRSRIQEFNEGKITPETFFMTELRQTRRDGTSVTTEVIAHFWMNSSTGKLEIHGSTRNIEERKRVENQLRESQRRYAALMDRLPGMAYRRNVDARWTFEFVSSGCKEVTGYTGEELTNDVNLSYLDLIKPDEADAVKKKWDQVLRTRMSFDGEYQIIGKQGDLRWVWEKAEGLYDDAGNIIAVEGFISDITARRHAEAERERLMSAIEQSSEAITITDSKGTIVYVNPVFYKVSGYAREEAIGKNSRILQSGMQSPAFYKQMWTVLSGGKTWVGQFVNKRKDGTFYTEEATISPAFDTKGNIVSYIAVKRDITQQIISASEKNALQAQVLQTQKLESVGCLAGGVAHDFNNMLQAIIGYAEMALDQIPPDQPLRDDIQEIKAIAVRSTNLTRQLLTFARKQPVVPMIANVNEIIDGMMNMLRRLVGENIETVWNPSPKISTIMIDKGQLEQIIFNLCTNARDAINKTGRILISTVEYEKLEKDPSIPNGLKPGRYVEVIVKDNGLGISPEIKKRIFEPFFTTKPLGYGTGLGLSVVYGIVTQCGGIIDLETEVGKGSEFRIFLPVLSCGKTNEILADEPTAVDKPIHAKILLVDDEILILRPARQLLESLGHQVIATHSPQEAIEIMRENKNRINLLISDVMMPEMSGPEMLIQLLKISPRLQYFFMSGHTADLLEKQGIKKNEMNFIEKPFTRKELNDKIQEVLTA